MAAHAKMSLKVVSMTEDVPATVPQVVIVPTTAAHIRELSRTIRAKDKAEIENYGFTHTKGLWRSFKQGMFNRTALIDGKVAACWGVVGTYLGSTAQPYLLTSDEVYKISSLKFARIYQREVYEMLSMFPYLVNWVDASYEQAVRLLSIVGFDIGEPEKMGGGMFRKFEMRGKE